MSSRESRLSSDRLRCAPPAATRTVIPTLPSFQGSDSWLQARHHLQAEATARASAFYAAATAGHVSKPSRSEPTAEEAAPSPVLELPRRASAEPVPTTAVLSQYEPFLHPHTPATGGEEASLASEDDYQSVDYYDRHR